MAWKSEPEPQPPNAPLVFLTLAVVLVAVLAAYGLYLELAR